MPNNSSLYGSTPPTGTVSSSNYTTLYNGNGNYVPGGDNVIISGTLTVNGCAILTDCSTFSLLPANATTINFGGSATAMNIGAATGVTTILNQLSTANYSFPVSDGTANQVLITDGAGNLSFADVGSLDTNYTIQADTASGGANLTLAGSDGTTDSVKFANGSNVTVSRTDANTITIASSYVDTTYTQNSSTTTGGANLNLVGSDSSVDPVKFAGGTGITVSSTDANTITITNTETNIQYNIDASSTTGGANFNLTGSDSSLDTIKFANGTGISVTRTDANTITFTNTAPEDAYTIDATTIVGGANLNLTNSAATDSVAFKGSGATTVTRTSADIITVSSTDTNTTYTQNASSTTGGANLNLVGSDATTDSVKFASGTGITVTRTDANTITITNADPGSAGVTSITGTTNQIIASASTGAVTLSTPQDIATTSSPTFNDLTLTNNLTLNNGQVGNAVVSAYSGTNLGTLTWDGSNWVSSNGYYASQVRAGNVTVGYVDNQTIGTTSGDLTITSATGQVDIQGILDITGDYLNLNSDNSPFNAAMRFGNTSEIIYNYAGNFFNLNKDTVIDGNLGIDNALKINGLTTGYTTFNVAANGSDLSYTLPTAAGAANTVLTNDGSGNLSWALPGGGGSTFGNITIAVVDDNTISTTTGDLTIDSATNLVGIPATLNVDSGVLYVDATNNRVGINNTSPSYELHIDQGQDGITQFAMTTGERTALWTMNDGDDLLSLTYGTNPLGPNRLQFDPTNQWFNTGNLGVGTNTPAYTLDVAGDVKVGGDTIYNSYDNKWMEYTQGTNSLGNTYRETNFSATAATGVRVSYVVVDSRMELNTVSLATTAVTPYILSQIDADTIRSGTYSIQVTSGTEYQVLEVSLLHDDANTYLNTYSDIRTGNNLTTVSAEFIAGSPNKVNLLVTPVNAVTSYKAAVKILVK